MLTLIGHKVRDGEVRTSSRGFYAPGEYVPTLCVDPSAETLFKESRVLGKVESVVHRVVCFNGIPFAFPVDYWLFREGRQPIQVEHLASSRRRDPVLGKDGKLIVLEDPQELEAGYPILFCEFLTQEGTYLLNGVFISPSPLHLNRASAEAAARAGLASDGQEKRRVAQYRASRDAERENAPSGFGRSPGSTRRAPRC